MGTLSENASSIKTVFSNIKSAIISKGVTVADGVAVTAYPALIRSIETGGSSGSGINIPADIYNHGEITGLHPYYSCYWSLSSSTSTKWIINSDVIEFDETYTASITLGAPVYRGSYTKLYIDAEVVDGESSSSAYCNVYVGIRYCSAGAHTDRNAAPDAYVPLTDYVTKTNYDNTEPWYKLTRQIIEFDLTQLKDEPFFIMFRACDCEANIYSMWME